jgi:hypothetical protein
MSRHKWINVDVKDSYIHMPAATENESAAEQRARYSKRQHVIRLSVKKCMLAKQDFIPLIVDDLVLFGIAREDFQARKLYMDFPLPGPHREVDGTAYHENMDRLYKHVCALRAQRSLGGKAP